MYKFTIKYSDQLTDVTLAWKVYQKPPNDRPSGYSAHSDAFYSLCDKLHVWMIENDIKYFLEEDGYYTNIFFKKNSDAMLFKLTWC